MKKIFRNIGSLLAATLLLTSGSGSYEITGLSKNTDSGAYHRNAPEQRDGEAKPAAAAAESPAGKTDQPQPPVKKTTISLRVNDANDGREITDGVINLLRSANGADKWETIAEFRPDNGKEAEVVWAPEKYRYRWEIQEIPLGYKSPGSMPSVKPGNNELALPRNTEGVNNAVKQAKLNFILHVIPPVANQEWKIFSIKKPSNRRQNPDINPISFTKDLGSLFAPYREREDMLLLNQVDCKINRLVKSSYYGTYFYAGEYNAYKDLEKTSAISDDSGIAKIYGLSFDNWYRLSPAKNQGSYADEEYDKYEGSALLDNDDIVKERFVKAHNFHNTLMQTDRNIYIRGPRYINYNRTSFTYDVYYIKSGDANKIIADDFKRLYQKFFADGYTPQRKDKAEIDAALAEIAANNEAKKELETAKKRLEELKRQIEMQEQEEKFRAAYEKAKEALEAAEKQPDNQSLLITATAAVNAVPSAHPQQKALRASLDKLVEGFRNWTEFSRRYQHYWTTDQGDNDVEGLRDALRAFAALSQPIQTAKAKVKSVLTDKLAKATERQETAKKEAAAKAKEQAAAAEAAAWRKKFQPVLSKQPGDLTVADLQTLVRAKEEAKKLSARAQEMLLPELHAIDEIAKFWQEQLAKRRVVEEEAAKRRAAEEEAAKRRAAEEEAAKRRAAEEEAAKRRAAEEEAAKRRAAEEEAAKRRAAEEEAAKRRATEEEAAKRRAVEEEAAKSRKRRSTGEEPKKEKENKDNTAAPKWRQKHAKILAKKVNEITEQDGEAILDAWQDWLRLPVEARTETEKEGKLLEQQIEAWRKHRQGKLTKEEQEQAERFRENYADILHKEPENYSVDDLKKLQEALAAQAKFSQALKKYLQPEISQLQVAKEFWLDAVKRAKDDKQAAKDFKEKYRALFKLDPWKLTAANKAAILQAFTEFKKLPESVRKYLKTEGEVLAKMVDSLNGYPAFKENSAAASEGEADNKALELSENGEESELSEKDEVPDTGAAGDSELSAQSLSNIGHEVLPVSYDGNSGQRTSVRELVYRKFLDVDSVHVDWANNSVKFVI